MNWNKKPIKSLMNKQEYLEQYSQKYPKEYREYCHVNKLVVKDKQKNFPLYQQFIKRRSKVG